jgi:betaine-aldehyde dehydrogenase
MTSLAKEPTHRQLWIGGEWTPGIRGSTYPVENPATAQVIAEVSLATSEDVDRAISVAIDAGQKWGKATAVAKEDLLYTMMEIIQENTTDLALLEALNSGNPLQECASDIAKATRWLRYVAGQVIQLHGKTIPASKPSNLHLSLRVPYGIVGQITAFNHPLLFALSRIGVALATGNAVLLKPAQQTPLSILRAIELLADIIPSGLVNVLTGGQETGAALVRHPSIRRIAATGSVRTGLSILREAANADGLKHVTLELGGKNPLIVFPDCDIAQVAQAAVRGMNFNRCQGQSCGSTSRLFIHESICSQVLEHVVEITSKIQPGLPELPRTSMGPLISRIQLSRVEEYVDQAISEGATLILGGARPRAPELQKGYFYLPTIFENVQPHMSLAKEEVFGPILSVFRWHNYEQMLAAVNSLRYGLTASIWTNDINQAIRTAQAVEAGYIWINGVESRWLGVPFGGFKDSGLGKERELEELFSYTREKSINVLTY